jgi:hypothetical protein
MSAFADDELVVYLKADPNQPAAPVAIMKRELTSLMSTAGYRVQWGDESHSPLLVVVELNGTCALPLGYPVRTSASSAGALATTAVTDGQVLPFASVNCAALARSLSAPLAGDPTAQRDYYFGRAMARVVAHELYHIIMRTPDHSQNGITRSCFSTNDLMTERFEFEGSVLAQLRHKEASPAVAVLSEDATDR